jgi:PAS domain S-box-containing protein
LNQSGHTRSMVAPPRWLRLSSVLVLVFAVVLFVLSLRSEIYRSRFSEIFVPCLLVALGGAVFLNIYSLWQARHEHAQTDRAFRNADSEFSSIFQNVLDGILILDDLGNCLDANPAASSILRVARHELIGEPIVKFFADRDSFNWKLESLRNQKYQRGHAELVGGNGTPLFVDFTAAANYIPGRHVVILCDATERRQAEISLRRSEERFQQMASHIQEVFWMMDAETMEVIYVNQAYHTLTGRLVSSLYESPSSYGELIHPEDRIRVLAKLVEAAKGGHFDEEFRIIRGDKTLRWVWVKASPVHEKGATRWLVGTAQDINSRKHAELQIGKHLDAAEAARAEAEALRKSTLALTQSLAMDAVLDTLLECFSGLVPFESGLVLLLEGGSELLVARSAPRTSNQCTGLTLNAAGHPFLQKILFEHKEVLLTDTSSQPDWRDNTTFGDARSWLGVPLVASGRILGVLSLGTNVAGVFTPEHLRLTKLLSIPAAVAIQNARMYERAEIYAAELEVRLRELRETRRALKHSDQ